MKLCSTAIGQGKQRCACNAYKFMVCHLTGEFGIVYKGILTDWNDVPIQGVAVKTLKGDINFM